jgi:hypothetical protein
VRCRKVTASLRRGAELADRYEPAFSYRGATVAAQWPNLDETGGRLVARNGGKLEPQRKALIHWHHEDVADMPWRMTVAAGYSFHAAASATLIR